MNKEEQKRYESLYNFLNDLKADHKFEVLGIDKKYHRDENGDFHHDGYMITLDFTKF